MKNGGRNNISSPAGLVCIVGFQIHPFHPVSNKDRKKKINKISILTENCVESFAYLFVHVCFCVSEINCLQRYLYI